MSEKEKLEKSKKENEELLERIPKLEEQIWSLIAERDGMREKNRRLRKDLDKIKALVNGSETREFQIEAPF